MARHPWIVDGVVGTWQVTISEILTEGPALWLDGDGLLRDIEGAVGRAEGWVGSVSSGGVGGGWGVGGAVHPPPLFHPPPVFLPCSRSVLPPLLRPTLPSCFYVQINLDCSDLIVEPKVKRFLDVMLLWW